MVPSQLFSWRRLAGQSTLRAADRDDEAARAFVYRALQNWVCEQQRHLGKRSLEGKILKTALDVAIGPIKRQLRSLACWSDRRADVANRG